VNRSSNQHRGAACSGAESLSPLVHRKVALGGQIRGVWASPSGLLWGSLPFHRRGSGPFLRLAFRRPHYLTASLTFDPASDQEPLYSPDGSQIVRSSNRKGLRDLYRKAASGAGEDQLLLASKYIKVADDWSPDGRFLLYATGTENAGQDLWLLPLKADGTPSGPPHPFLTTPFNEDHGRFSPDGHWIAYMSDESGKYEVYVRPFPIPAGGGGKWQVSTGGGSQPLWRRDGRELLYFSPDSKLMSVDVSTGTTFKAATSKPLFSAAITGGPFGTSSQHWAITPDGQRFLIEIEPEITATSPMTVVVNWTAGLKK
jgi:Tol biopolymer transport system component